MPTERKAKLIDELADKLGRSHAAVLVHYRGLTVGELGDFRGKLRTEGIDLHVTKNTLLREAAHRINMMDIDAILKGPNAVAFIYDNEPAAARVINDYIKQSKKPITVNATILSGQPGTPEDLVRLADMPSKTELLAKVAGVLQAPASRLLNTINAPIQNMAYALAAFQDQRGSTDTAA